MFIFFCDSNIKICYNATISVYFCEKRIVRFDPVPETSDEQNNVTNDF